MIGNVKSGTLGTFNVGLAAAVGLVNPLCAQVDALIAAGLGPFKADVQARLDAAVAAQAAIAFQVSNPLDSLLALLNALVSMQAAIVAALSFPTPTVEATAELSVMAALSGTLNLQLVGLEAAIAAALGIKAPALSAAAALAAHLSAGPAFAFTYEGPLAVVGAEIAALYSGGLVDGPNTINPGDSVYGVTLLTSVPSVQAALSAIIQVP